MTAARTPAAQPTAEACGRRKAAPPSRPRPGPLLHREPADRGGWRRYAAAAPAGRRQPGWHWRSRSRAGRQARQRQPHSVARMARQRIKRMAVPGPGPAPAQATHNRKAPAQARTSRGGTAAPGRADHHAARGTAKQHNPGGTTCPQQPQPGQAGRNPAPTRPAKPPPGSSAPSSNWTQCSPRRGVPAPGPARSSGNGSSPAWPTTPRPSSRSWPPTPCMPQPAWTSPSSALPSPSTTANWRSWSATATRTFPRHRHPAGDAESGRGLLMVEALSDRYGWYPLEGGTAGKVVWAVLRTRPDVPGDDLAAGFTP